ncbi:MAG: T9SS type A sorting domain-containing protein [Saprospiraceae bacterium]|nr:T9SS type A sorting domain-containing protein [Lewinella sp.]
MNLEKQYGIDTTRFSTIRHSLDSFTTSLYHYDEMGNRVQVDEYNRQGMLNYIYYYLYDDQNRPLYYNSVRVEGTDTINGTESIFHYQDLYTRIEYLSYNTAGDTITSRIERELFYLADNIIDSTVFNELDLKTQQRSFIKSDKYFYSTLNSSRESVSVLTYTVYPNPAQSSVNLMTDDYSGQLKHINIYSISGQLLQTVPFRESATMINLSGWSKGIYFLRLDHYPPQKLIVH